MDGKWIDRHDKFNVFISFEGENPLKKQKGKREKQRAQRIAGLTDGGCVLLLIAGVDLCLLICRASMSLNLSFLPAVNPHNITTIRAQISIFYPPFFLSSDRTTKRHIV